jgi:hypothetical protein
VQLQRVLSSVKNRCNYHSFEGERIVKVRQAIGATLFLLSCVGFGYLSTQKFGVTTTAMIGGGMFSIGVIAHLKQKPVPRQRTNKSIN